MEPRRVALCTCRFRALHARHVPCRIVGSETPPANTTGPVADAATAATAAATEVSAPTNTSAATEHYYPPRPVVQDLVSARGSAQAVTGVAFGINLPRHTTRSFAGRTRAQFDRALSAAFPGGGGDVLSCGAR